jgi:long-chain fatty acid transport protein
MCRLRKAVLIIGTALGSATLNLEVNAGAFAVREQSATGQGMAFAGEGVSELGLSAMFWNPAAVTQARGIEIESDLSGVFTDLTINTLPSSSSALLALGSSFIDIGRATPVGSTYMGYQYDPSLFFGMAVTSPFGQKVVTPLVWPGQNLSLEAKVEAFEGNPIIGYKLGEAISLAAGLRLLGARAKLTRALIPSTTAPNVVELKISGVGVGWNAGATITPWDGAELTLGYRSAVLIGLDGQTALPTAAPLSGSFKIAGDISLPGQASLGARQRITETVALLGTVEWQNWGSFQELPFNFTSGPVAGATAATLKFHYRDSWYFAAGGEYLWDPKTTFRAGAGYEITPIIAAVRSPAVL